jgi:hypothetical protein
MGKEMREKWRIMVVAMRDIFLWVLNLDTRIFLRVLGPKINEENQGLGLENLNAIPRD